jgi:cell wall-associated NlpC family hydrolase
MTAGEAVSPPAGGRVPFGGLGPQAGRRSSWAGSRAGLDALLGADRAGGAAAQRAVAYAETKLGAPYVWGAAGPRAYDCSGLVADAYAHAGISLPRSTYELIGVGTAVGRGEVRAGDLVFSNFSSRGPEHVQLAVSPAMVIEAPAPGGRVQFSGIPSGRIVVKRVG